MIFTLENVLSFTSYGMIVIMSLLVYASIKKRKSVQHWGVRLLSLWGIGLVLCIVVAMRDNYHLSVAALSDSSIQPGRFSADSIQSTMCMLLGGLNFLILFSSLLIRKQNFFKISYFVLTIVIVMKVLIIELSMLL
jgi:hypothetical protein